MMREGGRGGKWEEGRQAGREEKPLLEFRDLTAEMKILKEAFEHKVEKNLTKCNKVYKELICERKGQEIRKTVQ